MELVLQYLPYVSEGLVALMVLATIVVKLTKSSADDVMVDSFSNKLLKAMSYLPTIGVNPRTKHLEEALKELSK